MGIRLMCAALAASGAIAGQAMAVSPFFTENFTNADEFGGWSGGAFYSNPGTGGVDGENDGYLIMSQPTPGSLGVRSTTEDYVGDLIAAGVTGLSLWLNDVGGDQNLRIYVGFGNTVNFWQYNEGFEPLNGEWSQFFVDFTDPSKWNAIGAGPSDFEEALRNTDRILIRHDTFPGSPTGTRPVPIAGEVGIDKIQFIPAPGAAALLGLSGLSLLRRRRA